MPRNRQPKSRAAVLAHGAISIERAEEVKAMAGIRPDVDPDGLLEYSVVFTDRALNHMSQSFQGVMRDISATLKGVYGAASIAIVPGGGTYGMEAVARQFATDQKCMVLRNGSIGPSERGASTPRTSSGRG